MPAASEVVRQYARYYTFAFNLDIARPVFERAPDLTVVAGRTTVLPRGLNRAATGCPDQGTYNDRGNSPQRGVLAKQPNADVIKRAPANRERLNSRVRDRKRRHPR